MEERVPLREEHVRVERRPVDRPIGDAGAAFGEDVIEIEETAEEVVVAKEARVVFGIELAGDAPGVGREWSAVEPEARRRWEERNPGTWGRFMDSIRYAWERAGRRRAA